MDSVTSRKEINELNRFDTVEYAIGETAFRHKFKKLSESIDVVINKPVYRSYFLHSEEILEYYNSHYDDKGNKTLSDYVGCVLSEELKIDIDEKEDSLDQVRGLLKKWEAVYDLDLRHIRVNFSGSKGFHIRIPAELFGGFEPSEELPAIHKQIALDLTEGVKIDESVYKTTGLFREVNSINKKSGLFAVPLSINEVFTLSYDEIKQLAKAQREIEYLDADEMLQVDALEELKVRALPDPRPVTIKLRPGKNFWEPAEEGERFDKLTSAIGRLIRTNLSNDDILQLGLMVNNQYNPPKDEKIVKKQIRDLINKYGKLQGNFWVIERETDDKGKREVKVNIDLNQFINFLNAEGFAKIYLEKYPLFIRIIDNIIKEFSSPQIKDYVMSYVNQMDMRENPYRAELQNKLLNGVGKYFNESLLECVETKVSYAAEG